MRSPRRFPVIAALRPIRAGDEVIFGSIGDGSHRNKREDDNPDDEQPKPAPQARVLGVIRVTADVARHASTAPIGSAFCGRHGMVPVNAVSSRCQ
jgi:hypothetical protein